jgi:hypothetical protein
VAKDENASFEDVHAGMAPAENVLPGGKPAKKDLESDLADFDEAQAPEDDSSIEEDSPPEKGKKDEAFDDLQDPSVDDDSDEEEPVQKAKERKGKDDADDDSGFSPEILSRAADLGLSDEDAKGFSSAKELDRALVLLEKRAGSAQRQEPEAAEVKEEEFELNEEDFDPALVSAFKGMKAEIKNLRNEAAVRKYQEKTDRFDDWIKGRGEEMEEVYGKGNAQEVRRGTKAFQNRSDVYDMAETLRERYRAIGRNVPESTILERAERAILGDQLDAIKTESRNKQVRTRRNQFSSRPTARKATGMKSGTAKAEATVGRLMKEMGGEY